ncbi:MAG TPA: YdcF family protein [Caulobacteraceae bacterium]|nr:YdcF family protein [Caulobacteraceae bacterium]
MRTLAALFVVLLVWSTGLLAFAARVDRMTPADDPAPADGIVALTGGSGERIVAGMRLLEDNRARRLLISGVGQHVTRSQLQDIVGAAKPLFDCCVDLGFQAANTLGNARETANWARAHGFKTLILATADYHMPRARLELRAALPEATIEPYPVATTELKTGEWWKTQLGAQRMTLEYCKYLAVLARETLLGLGPKPAPPRRG